MQAEFKVALTRDFLTPEGRLTYPDIGLRLLDEAGLGYEFFGEHQSPVAPEQLENLDVVISLAPKYTAQSLEDSARLLAILRFGVGYDMVDVEACTSAGVLLCITAGAVNHSVAEATVGWMLALSHRMTQKDRLVREGGWVQRSNYMGRELREKTVGIVGLGGIGGKLIELLRPFGINDFLAFDPFQSKERAHELGARLVALDELLRESDFVSINCPLTESTRGLIGREQLALMKPTAFLINTARGGIVDEDALVEVLRQERIAGAATDVFTTEPARDDNPLLQLDNVLLAPHCIAWTDELFRDIGHMACQQAIQLSRGEIPPGVVNRDVLENPRFLQKLHRFKSTQ